MPAIHRLVISYCLPEAMDVFPHVSHRIDEYLTPLIYHDDFIAACKAGVSNRTLELLLQRTIPVWRDAVDAAVQGGHLHVLRWMTERQDHLGPWRGDFDSVIDIAAMRGHLDVVKWLYERGVDCENLKDIDKETTEYLEKTWLYHHCLAHALMLAVKHGHLEVAQWIYNVRNGLNCRDPIIPFNKPIDEAVENGHLPIVQWLHTISDEICFPKTMDMAAVNGHLEVLQWLASNHLLICTTAAMDGAAQNGHLRVVKWLHETRTEGCSSGALYLAARNGHFEVVEWLYDNKPMNFDIPDNMWTEAARGGHLRVLQWLYNHFPTTISMNTMDAAAKSGHLEVLIWLHELGIEEWTHEAPFFQPMYLSQPRPRLEVIQWLHAHYPSKFVTGVGSAAARGYLDIVQWLHENNIEGFTTAAMDRAAEYGHLNMVLYLLEHRSEGFTRDAMINTRDIEVHCLFSDEVCANEAKRDQLNMLQSLFKARPSFVRGCLRCLAEIALRVSNIKILDWVNQFGLELLSTTPIRNAVKHNYVHLLQWFHRNELMVNEPDLLKLAVRYESVDAASWLWMHGYEINWLKFTEIAKENMAIPMLRWLLDHGPPPSLTFAFELAVSCDCVEVMRWLPEQHRAEIVIWALHQDEPLINDARKMIWWILTRTLFDESSRRNIRNETRQLKSSKILLWLKENLANSTACNWVFTATENDYGHGDQPTKKQRTE